MSDDADRTETPQAEDRVSLLWRRVKEHRIAQWTVGYVAVAYAIQHAVILTSESFEWPNIVARISMLLLALGLPLAMTLAWYHGARASRRISGPELSIISILLVIGTFLFYVFARPAENIAAGLNPAAQQASVTAARAASASLGNAISIAVLPFANVSADATQDFFSDGMTDEIAGALAKVPDLRVVARSSAFQFKGQNQEARAMGQALGATHLIEGSVRQAGNRVRITAQLIQAENGLQIWSENYDRELTDVFAIQEDIARSITTSLRMPLGLKPGENLVNNRSIDPESYQQYLRARALFRARNLGPAVMVLNAIVARDPNYAPAWALLAVAERLLANRDPDRALASVAEIRQINQAANERMERAAREAMRLDPKSPGAIAAQAYGEAVNGRPAIAEDLFRQALALDPNDPDILNSFSQQLAFGPGRLKESLRLREQLRALEPFVPYYNIVTADILQRSGQDQAAIAILDAIPPDFADELGLLRRTTTLARAYAQLGRYSEAADTLLAMRSNLVSRQRVEDAARLLRTAPAKVKAPDALPVLGVALSFVYVHVGAPERVMDALEGTLETSANVGFSQYSPVYAPVRKTARFKAFIRKSGLLDYWRAKGWPDLCHPVGADDFVCD